MVVYSGGAGSQSFTGTSGNDVIYGFSAADVNASSGRILATAAATGLSAPVFAGSTSADSRALYVLEKDEGRIIRVDLDSGTKTTFLDIPNTSFGGGGERGLLGMAFHPNYAANGRFFVFVTQPNGDLQVREYARSGGDPLVANPTLVKTIITIPHSTYGNHNGGALAFGPDGYLYISTGDGGGGNDPDNNGQNINTLLGKILRLDVNRDDFPADGTRNYGIPATNPFAGTAGADEIWDYGLRNPWRMSFDRVTGDLWIGDVGQGSREEIDVHRAGTPGGLNFGWDAREGDLPGPGSGSGPFVDPIHVYDRNDGQSVTGGYVYRGPDPGLQGAYLFADFVSNKIWALVPRGATFERVDLTSRIDTGGAPIGSISSFGVDASGELYVVSLGGTVYRLDLSAAAGDGNDILNGGAGADTIYGGAGDDLLYGGSGGDAINGGIGNDLLNGGTEADVMRGGAGNDRYVVDSAGDRVIEIAGQGTDYIFSSVSYNNAAGVERVFLTGSANINSVGVNTQNDLILGNAGNNFLFGLGGNDSLNGGSGADRLVGGPGNDALAGGAGADFFYFTTAPNSLTNRDYIVDFVAANDTIVLENAIFTSLGATGFLSPGLFKNLSLGGADANDRILYNDANGALYYDIDGSGAAAPVLFAILAGSPTVTAVDFFVI